MHSKGLPEKIAKRLRLPLIAAPMLAVSGPDLAIAACKAGVIGSFPLPTPERSTVSKRGSHKSKLTLPERQTKPPINLPRRSAPT